VLREDLQDKDDVRGIVDLVNDPVLPALGDETAFEVVTSQFKSHLMGLALEIGPHEVHGGRRNPPRKNIKASLRIR
jgi:hypothetical protein